MVLIMAEDYRQYEKLPSMFRILGNSTALKILNEADKGFKSGKETIRKLRLTPREYYRSLRRLQELGIIDCIIPPKSDGKKEHVYSLTAIGKNLRRLVFNDFLSLLHNDEKHLDLLENLENHGRLTTIDDYGDLVKLLTNLIERARSQILIATRYVDFSVSQSMIQALQRGVKLKSVTDKRLNLPQFLKLIGGLLRNINSNLLKYYLTSKDYRIGDIPISFSIVDNEVVVFELPTKEFEMAFLSKDKTVLKVFHDIFWKIWKNSPVFDVGGGELGC
jgi:DNA-binding PadR family transcriptional regulator